MNQRQVLIPLLVIALVSAVGMYLYKEKRQADAPSDMEIEASFTKFTDSLNKRLPRMINSETRIDSASASSDRHVRYYATLINYTAADLPPKAIRSLAENLKDAVCKSNLTGMLGLGWRVSYLVRGSDGEPVTEIAMTSLQDCAAQSNGLKSEP